MGRGAHSSCGAPRPVVGGKAEVSDPAWATPCSGGPAGVQQLGPSPQQTAPHAGPPPAPPPLPQQEEETRRPSPGLPTAAAASPAPAPPRAAAWTSGIPAPARGEWGRRSGRSSRPGTRCSHGASHARQELCSDGQEPGRRPPHPKLEPNFLVPSWSSPARLHPGESLVPWRDSGGGGARGMPAGPGGGVAGGGGMWNSPGGPNVVTMASAGRTGGTSQSEHGFTPRPVCAANGNQAVGWAGPRLAGPDPRTPSSR